MAGQHSVVKNSFYLYVRMFLIMLVTLYTSRVVLASIGETDYGIYNVVGGIVTILWFINMSLTTASTRFITLELGRGNETRLLNTFAASLNIHIGLAILTLFLGETVGLWFFKTQLVIPPDRIDAAMWVYQFSIITTMINFTQVPYYASIISHEDMGIYAKVGMYEVTIILAIALAIDYSPFDRLVFYAFLLMVEKCSAQMILRYYSIKHYKECRFILVKDKKLYLRLLSFSGWSLTGNFSYIGLNYGINLVLNIFFGPIVNAARALSMQVYIACNSLIENGIKAAEPRIIKNYAAGEYDAMYKLTFRVSRYISFLMLFAIIPAITEVDTILTIWLGEYPDETIVFTIIVLVSTSVQIQMQTLMVAFNAVGRIKTGSIIAAVITVIAIIVCCIVFKYGYPASFALIITFISNIIIYITDLFLLRRYIRFSIWDTLVVNIIPVIFIGGIAFAVSNIITQYIEQSTLRLISNVVITDMVLLSLIYFAGIDTQERNYVKQVIANKLHIKS